MTLCAVFRRALPLVTAGRCAGCSHAAAAVDEAAREIVRALTMRVVTGNDAEADAGLRCMRFLERRPGVKP